MKKRILTYILTLTTIIASISLGQSQEIRIYGGTQLFGYIDDGFEGVGLGFENHVYNKSSIVLDLNIGFHTRGTAYAFKPSYLFYIKEGYKGFFIGPSLKYITIDEPDNNDSLEDHIYAFGFTTGLKSNISNHFSLILQLNPHYSVGGQREGNVAGISGQFGIDYKLF